MGEFASRGVGTAALTTGIIGTGLGALNAMSGGCNNGGLLGGLLGGNNGCYINRYEQEMAMAMAAKDAKIGLLEADRYTDQKLTEVYKDLNSQISNLQSQISQQAVYNATVNGSISCIQGQIAQLMSLTKMVVPNSSVCPGWGNVTITPAAATTTTTPAA